jgi:[acyl-carrier-protein] S-malonyltransferase
MTRMAMVFPGQGAQYVGMGKEIAKEYGPAREVFARASEALSMDIEDLCWEGSEDELRMTANAQPAILATSTAYAEVLRAHDVKPERVAGLSLGEYSALVCAGALDFADAMRVVRTRGELMQSAVPDGVGGMAAVIGLENELVEKACREASCAGVVEPANYNCPGQVVISGERAAVEEASRVAISYGARRVIPLVVSAPFHCSMMKPAAERLGRVLSSVLVTTARIPVVSNVSAVELQEPSDIRTALEEQVSHPVKWEQSIRRMIAEGLDTFLEVGPGKTLTGFIKKISPQARCFNFDSRESLETILAEVGA